MSYAEEAAAQLRLLQAARRIQAGQDGPTLGRFFPDTPGVPCGGDPPPPARVLPFEEWAVQDTDHPRG